MEISFGDEKHGQQIWVICLLCDLPPNFSPKKNIIWAIFRQAIKGSKFDEKFVKFPPHWPDERCLPEEISDEVRRSLVWDESEFQSMELR